MCELSYMIIFCLFKSFVLWLRRSGLLTFFSSLVIQESLINCANERLRSRIFSHCENILSFCLSASHPWSWTRAHILYSWTRAHRPDVHFLICPHDSSRVPCVISVQWFGPERSPSYPLKKSLKLLLQTLRVVESYPFTKFDKIPLINFADFSSL